MKETLSDIRTRRSCRKYQPRQVSTEELDTVLEAATWAPTGHGLQSPLMVVVQEPEMMKELSRLNAQIMGAKHDPLYGAPTAVIVFADATNHTGQADAANVMATLLLAAHATGLASCWINRAKEMFELPEGFEIQKKWGIADNYEGFAIAILGYEAPGGTLATPKPRKEGYVVRV